MGARRDGGHGRRVRGVRRDARGGWYDAGGGPGPGRGALATRDLRTPPSPEPGRSRGRVCRGPRRGPRRRPRRRPHRRNPAFRYPVPLRPGRLRGGRRVHADPVRVTARVVLRGDGVRESEARRDGSRGASRGDAALDVQRVPGGRCGDGGDGEWVQARGSGDGNPRGTRAGVPKGREDRGRRRG